MLKLMQQTVLWYVYFHILVQSMHTLYQPASYMNRPSHPITFHYMQL